MKKKHIYIPIEIFVREINSKILLSYYASLKDYRVYLCTKVGIDKIINKKLRDEKKAGIFFHKSQIINNRSYAKKIRKACEKFVVLDEELGVGVSNINFTLKKEEKI